MQNARAFKALSPKFQDIVTASMAQAAVDEREDIQKMNATAALNLKKFGMVFSNPEPTAFREVLRKAGWYKEWKGKLGNEVWALLEKYAGELS